MKPMFLSIDPFQTSPPECLIPPWKENPNRPVTWWDVISFCGVDLQAALCGIEQLSCSAAHAQPAGDPVAARLMGQQPMLGKPQRVQFHVYLTAFEDSLVKSGLSGQGIGLLRMLLVQLATYEIAISAEQFARSLKDIQQALAGEMSTTVFVNLNPSSVDLFTKPLQNWDVVAKRWPELKANIRESSLCFALERYGAAAFHILLVAEYGVIQVCNLFGVSGDRPGWGGVQRLERLLKTPYEDRSGAAKAHSSLLTEIVPMMISVRDAVRHKISHVDNYLKWLDADFGPLAAEEVRTAARGFMRRLALELPQS